MLRGHGQPGVLGDLRRQPIHGRRVVVEREQLPLASGQPQYGGQRVVVLDHRFQSAAQPPALEPSPH
jgi:hypothetical protein